MLKVIKLFRDKDSKKIYKPGDLYEEEISNERLEFLLSKDNSLGQPVLIDINDSDLDSENIEDEETKDPEDLDSESTEDEELKDPENSDSENTEDEETKDPEDLDSGNTEDEELKDLENSDSGNTEDEESNELEDSENNEIEDSNNLKRTNKKGKK